MNKHEQAVRAAARRYQETDEAHEKAREELAAVVIEALKAGERPTDVTNWSPFTATYVRKLARKHGVEAAGHTAATAVPPHSV
jgi:hypothetical protein